MNKDMHTFLEDLEREKPNDVLRVSREVSPEFEIPAFLNQIEMRKRQPVIIFEKVRNLKGSLSKMPVVVNLFGSRDRLAYSLGVDVDRLPMEYVAREKPVPPKEVKKSSARVKEVIEIGEAIDLYNLPIVTHHEMDIGPYITAPTVWVKDPETGWVNCAMLRIYVPDRRRLVVNFNPARHTQHIFRKYSKLGVPMPCAIVVGHHPAFYLGAQTKLFTNEPEIIGGMMGEAVEVTPSETWGEDLFVPAQADVVIEAEISTSEVELEAPFGEYTQYYGGQRLNPTTHVKAITHRRDAVWLDIMPGHADHLLLDAPALEATLYQRVKSVVPGVTAVNVPVSGTARLHAYVQIRKSNDAEPKTVIASVLSSDYRIKHVIVVDEDVDIHDDAQVLWAVATRSQWDKDVMILKGMMGTRLDPTAEGVVTTKGGIDATKPCDPHAFAMRLSIPKEVVDRMRPEDYLDPENLKKI